MEIVIENEGSSYYNGETADYLGAIWGTREDWIGINRDDEPTQEAPIAILKRNNVEFYRMTLRNVSTQRINLCAFACYFDRRWSPVSNDVPLQPQSVRIQWGTAAGAWVEIPVIKMDGSSRILGLVGSGYNNSYVKPKVKNFWFDKFVWDNRNGFTSNIPVTCKYISNPGANPPPLPTSISLNASIDIRYVKSMNIPSRGVTMNYEDVHPDDAYDLKSSRGVYMYWGMPTGEKMWNVFRSFSFNTKQDQTEDGALLKEPELTIVCEVNKDNFPALESLVLAAEVRCMMYQGDTYPIGRTFEEYRLRCTSSTGLKYNAGDITYTAQIKFNVLNYKR